MIKINKVYSGSTASGRNNLKAEFEDMLMEIEHGMLGETVEVELNTDAIRIMRDFIEEKEDSDSCYCCY